MGVLGLTPFILKTCPDVLKQLPDRLRGLAGKTIVIDATLVTQRLHFAQVPHPYRHVLGWYRVIKELNNSEVAAICVFDGKERSLAKAQEAERRKEVQRLAVARGSIEVDRLKRLRRLIGLLDHFHTLKGTDRKRVTDLFRQMTLETEPTSNQRLPSWYQNGDHLDLLRYIHNLVNSYHRHASPSPVSHGVSSKTSHVDDESTEAHKILRDQVEQLLSGPPPDLGLVMDPSDSQDHLDSFPSFQPSFGEASAPTASSRESSPPVSQEATPSSSHANPMGPLHEPLTVSNPENLTPSLDDTTFCESDWEIDWDLAADLSLPPEQEDSTEMSPSDNKYMSQMATFHSHSATTDKSPHANLEAEPSLPESAQTPSNSSQLTGVVPTVKTELPIVQNVPPLAHQPEPRGSQYAFNYWTTDQLSSTQLQDQPFPSRQEIDPNDQQYALAPEPSSNHFLPTESAVADTLTALASLYFDYRSSIPKLASLSTSASSSPPLISTMTEDDGLLEAQPEYVMTKSQYQLTLDEGKLWKELAGFPVSETQDPNAIVTQTQTANATVANLASLAERSSLMSASYQRRTNPPTMKTYEECKEILQAMGVPCIESAGTFEGEALASSLVVNGLADYVASEDTDVLVYGAPLIRNITNRQEPLVIVSGADIRAALQLDRASFIDFALLLGTDFSQRLKNVGPSRALKFIKEHGSIEYILERETKFLPRVPRDVYFQQVEDARVVFQTLPPVPDQKLLERRMNDEEEVMQILQRYGLHRAAMCDWDYEAALDGNYFKDNPSAF